MKKSDLKKMVREELRTRFMFEKETSDEPTTEEPKEISPVAQKPEEETPHDKAISMGLTDKKWGRYADNTGKIVAKVIDGNLVKVAPQDPEETREAPEPSKSGFNYDDAYGGDYPKPKGQLGAVPPTFAPVPSMKPISDDPYSNPSKIIGSKDGRTSRLSIGSITGNKDDNKNAQSIAATWSPVDKSDASSGGVGTYKDAGRQGALIRTSPDGTEMTWSQDGPMKTYSQENSIQQKEGKIIALSMTKKYGKDIALSKTQKALKIEEDKFRQLSSHNSNSSASRLKQLEKMQTTIDRLRHAISALGNPQSVNESKTDAGEQATKLGLIHKGWGRYADKTGKIVAKAVNGHLVRMAPRPERNAPAPEIAPEAPVVEPTPMEEPLGIGRAKEKELLQFFKEKGIEYVGRTPQDTNNKTISPGWNHKQLHAEVEFDANAEETVNMLVEKIGDPIRTMRWLIKKFKNATPSGKKRIGMYILILKKMIGNDDANELTDPIPII